MKLTKEDIRSLLAKIYYNACLDCGTDMKALADVLEYLAEKFSNENSYSAWNRIKLDRQRFDKSPYVQYLSTLRQEYHKVLAAKLQQEIENFITQEKFSEAFSTWKKAYSSSLATWKAGIYTPLCNANPRMPDEYRETIHRFRDLNRFILETKWVESYPYYLELASDISIDAYERSCFEICAGQIQLYWMPDFKESLQHFERAQKICETNPKSIAGLGEYYIKLQEFEKARSYLLKAISMDPYDVDNYLRMGDSYRDENKLDAAEQWYTDALNMNFLEPATYSRLVLLFGDTELMKTRRDVIGPMIQKMQILEPDDAFNSELFHFYRNVGHSFLSANDAGEARTYYLKAMELKPETTAAMIDLGNMYSKAADYASGEEWLKMAISKAPDNFDAYWGLAWLYEQQKKFGEAEQAYMQCKALRPSWTDSVYNFAGVMFDNNKDYEKAKKCYEQAIAFSDKEPVYHENLRDVLIKMNRNDELEDVLTRMHELFPGNTGYAYQLGQYYDERQQTNRALQYYTKALENDPTNAVYYESVGLLQEKLGNAEEAEKSFLKSLELQENYSTANRLGIFYYKQKKYEKAIFYYQKAISLSEKDAVLWGNLGLAFEDQGNLQEAENAYLRAADLNEIDGSSHNRLGLFYYNQKDYTKAITWYKLALEKQPESFVYMGNLGLAYEDLGNFAEAEKAYLRAADLNEIDGSSHNRVGIFYYNQKDYTKAISWYKLALEKQPEYFVYIGNLGLAYENKGDLQEAESAYLHAARLNHTDGSSSNRVGLFYYNRQEYSRAIPWYKQALEKEPGNLVYLENLALAYDFENQWSASLPLYEKLLQRSPEDHYFEFRLGVALYKTGNPLLALEHFIKIKQHISNDLVYLDYLGNAYELTGDAKEAFNVYMEALKMAPENDYFNNKVGIQYFNKGDQASLYKALDYYQKAINSKPDIAAYHYNKGLVYSSFDDGFEQAQSAYEKAISIEPYSDLYHNEYGVLLFRNQLYKEAIEEFKKAIELNDSSAVYFTNLGLAYDKLNDVDNSVLAYEKAKAVQSPESL
jgi:tetratricopeptide (TPR) repeat protein